MKTTGPARTMVVGTEPILIMDIRGLLIHSLNRGKDDEAIQPEDGSKPVNTAAYGFGQFIDTYLKSALAMVPPRRLIAVWDGGNEYRKGLWKDYKAHRKEAKPDENRERKELYGLADRLLKGLGAFQVSVKDVEADDVIAYLVKNLPCRKVVYTVDADLLVLHTGMDTDNGCIVYQRGEYREKYNNNVPLPLITLYKSIVGDSSDGYPGIKGMGEAAWTRLLEAYGEDGLLELDGCVKTANFAPINDVLSDDTNADLVKLYEHRYDWALQYKLAALRPELCTGRNKNKFVKLDWVKRVPSVDRITTACADGGVTEIPDWLIPHLPTVTLVTQDNMATELRRYNHLLDTSPYVSFDFESYDTLRNPAFTEASSSNSKTFVDVLSQKITGCSFTVGENMQHTFYVSVDHKDTANCKLDVIQWALMRAERRKLSLVAQNASFEVTLCGTNMEWVPSTAPFDTKILASYVDENLQADLKSMSKHWLNYQQTTYGEVVGDREGMHQLTGTEVLQYATDDAVCTACLFDLFVFITQLEKTFDFINTYERDVLWPLADAFYDGIRIDQGAIALMRDEDANTVREGRARIRELLEEHCREPNQAAATTLFNELWSFEYQKLIADGADAEKMRDKQVKLWERVYFGSQYRPYVETREQVEFKPTAANIVKVAKAVGLTTPKLESVAINKVNEWMSRAWDSVSDPKVKPEGDIVKRHEFMRLLGAAASQLKKKEGDEYEELSAFCVEVLKDTGKVTTAGDELNFDSPVQMQDLFYGKLALPIRVRSKVQEGSTRQKLNLPGAPATDEKAVAMALAEDVGAEDWRRELLTFYLAVKKAMTREEFYWRPYPLWVHPRDGAVHGSIMNCGTVTRRPTGSSPNLLQISKKDGGRVRTMIKPRYDDHVIVSADFSGQELRLMASEAKEPVLLDAYLNTPAKDIHSLTAANLCPILLPRLFPSAPNLRPTYEEFVAMLKYEGSDEDSLKLAKVAKTIRNVYAKQTNFLIIYGGGPSTLARNVGIPTDLAKSIIDAWFKAFPGVQAWQEATTEFAKQEGYALTAYGNRRHVTEGILSGDNQEAGRWSRQAVNYQIQGCAADILKVVLAEAHRTGLFRDTGAILIAPIYDEITSSVPKSEAADYVQRLVQLMAVTPPGHAIPMEAEVSIGPHSLGELIELGANPSSAAIMAACDGKPPHE